MLRPQLEHQITHECEQAVGDPDGSFPNLRGICAEISRPASVCPVDEIERQGSLVQITSEAMGGQL